MKAVFSQKSKIYHLSIFVMFTLLLQGCIVAGLKLDKSDTTQQIDNSVITSSILPNIAQTEIEESDPILQQDQRFIRDKIVAAIKPWSKVDELKWDNAATGSHGIISAIVESKQNRQKCRKFQATRAAFDGEALYNGQMCQITNGVWNLTAFEMVK